MDEWNTGVPAPGQADEPPAAEGPPTCPWCAARVKADDTQCPDCGAAIAQRESIGGLKIPGLTSVDPALEDFDKRPLHLRGPSATHGVAPALIVGAMAGGPIGLVAIGGVAAVAAAEYMGTKSDGSPTTSLEEIGKPNELLLQALEREKDPAAATEASAATAVSEPDHAEDDGGLSIWRDLPPPTEGDDQGSV